LSLAFVPLFGHVLDGRADGLRPRGTL